MIDNKKEQERAELHRTTWGIANDLRGSVDGWDLELCPRYAVLSLYLGKSDELYQCRSDRSRHSRF